MVILKFRFWATDEQGDHILKVKPRFVKHLNEFEKSELYNININFENYSMETDNGVIKGYYSKVTAIKPVVPKTIETNPEN